MRPKPKNICEKNIPMLYIFQFMGLFQSVNFLLIRTVYIKTIGFRSHFQNLSIGTDGIFIQFDMKFIGDLDHYLKASILVQFDISIMRLTVLTSKKKDI